MIKVKEKYIIESQLVVVVLLAHSTHSESGTERVTPDQSMMMIQYMSYQRSSYLAIPDNTIISAGG